jgi:hypothetical protein
MIRIITEERTEYVRNSGRVNKWRGERRKEKRFTFCGGGGLGEKSANDTTLGPARPFVRSRRPWNFNLRVMLKCIIWKQNLVAFRARGLVLGNLNPEGCARSRL